MSSGIGSYATTATVYGRAASDSYYQLNSPGLINGDVEITGNLKVDGTTELVGALTCDALATASAGLTVGGAAVAPTVPGLNVQSSAGRIQLAPASNGLSIQGFDANGDTAPISINTRDALAPVILPAVTATSASISGLLSAATAGGAAFTAVAVADSGINTNRGYWKQGNFLVQWGYCASSGTTVVFPLPFSSTFPAVQITANNAAPFAGTVVLAEPTQFTFVSGSSNNCWVALGLAA